MSVVENSRVRTADTAIAIHDVAAGADTLTIGSQEGREHTFLIKSTSSMSFIPGKGKLLDIEGKRSKLRVNGNTLPIISRIAWVAETSSFKIKGV